MTKDTKGSLSSLQAMAATDTPEGCCARLSLRITHVMEKWINDELQRNTPGGTIFHAMNAVQVSHLESIMRTVPQDVNKVQVIEEIQQDFLNATNKLAMVIMQSEPGGSVQTFRVARGMIMPDGSESVSICNEDNTYYKSLAVNDQLLALLKGQPKVYVKGFIYQETFMTPAPVEYVEDASF